jgi:RNA polymerase sigma-70 factor, ECF subfamily
MRDDDYGSAASVRPASARIPTRPRRAAVSPMSDRQPPTRIARSSTADPGDHLLVRRARSGDQDAATQFYFRYHDRLMNLVRRRCSAGLARSAGVEDIVQSVFARFFRRIGDGFYDVPQGDSVWKVLLVIALNRVRAEATYYFAARRDAKRTMTGPTAQELLKSKASGRDVTRAYFEMVFQETLGRLPCSDRQLVSLRIDGFTVAEVARMTGRSTRTVERIIHGRRLALSDRVRIEH